MNDFDDLLEAMASCPRGPHAPIDQSLCERLLTAKGKPLDEKIAILNKILEDAVFAPLASEFGLHVMTGTRDLMVKKMKEQE